MIGFAVKAIKKTFLRLGSHILANILLPGIGSVILETGYAVYSAYSFADNINEIYKTISKIYLGYKELSLTFKSKNKPANFFDPEFLS